MGLRLTYGDGARYIKGKIEQYDWNKDKAKMKLGSKLKKRLAYLLGIILVLPFWLSIILSVTSRSSAYNQWIFEKAILPIFDDLSDGSYIRGSILLFGLVVGWVVYTHLVVKCFLYDPAEQRDEELQERARKWIND